MRLGKKVIAAFLGVAFIASLSSAIVFAKPFVWRDRPTAVSKQTERSSPYSSLPGFSILGEPVATKEQCVKYLLKYNPKPSLTVSPQKLVDYYYEEGLREGVRPDVAFAQALQETGYFKYGGLVLPSQNNYCGLGTTGKSVKGAWFKSAQLGVRAHIQHILAYASVKKPQVEIVDPRYQLVTTTKNFGKAKTWTDLDGKWAVPGHGYGEKILKIHTAILAVK